MFMSLFEKAYKNAYTNLNENSFPLNSLDPNVFYFTYKGSDPVLMQGIENQIFNDVEAINHVDPQFVKTRIWDYFLTGPILDKDSSKNCPIIIKLQINKTNLDDVTKERILQRIKEINDRKAVGTSHPIVYIPTIREIDINELNAAYHPFTKRWLKKPSFLGENKKTAGGISRIKQKAKHNLVKGLKKLEGA